MRIRNSVGRIFLFAAVSAFLLLLRSECSYLFATNEWYDPNCFFTVGKGMANGLVPYRDLFEQKGIYIYALHALAYLITGNNFHGIYLFEIVALTIACVFAEKIAHMYVKRAMATVTAILYAVLSLASIAFFKGDSAEEFVMPLVLIGLYLAMRAIKSRSLSEIRIPEVLLVGFLAGIVLWIKYTLLGFFAGFAVMLFFSLFKREKALRAFFMMFLFLAGMALATIPCALYFYANDAVYEWLNTYFLVNAHAYTASPIFGGPVINVLIGNLQNLAINPLLSFLTIWGIVREFREGAKGSSARWFPLVTCGISGIFLYLGPNRFPYYQFVMFPYALLGLTRLVRRAAEAFSLTRWKGIFACVLTCLCVMLPASLNLVYECYFTDVSVQETFAAVISEKKDATLLNYGCLDAGFYTAADILPTTPYFCTLNLDPEKYPEMRDTQLALIAEKKVDFVVIEYPVNTDPEENTVPRLNKNYRLVKTGAIYKGIEGIRSYALFKRR